MIYDRVVVQAEEVSFTFQHPAKAVSDDIRATQNQIKNRVHSRLLCVNSTILQNKREFAPAKSKFITIMKSFWLGFIMHCIRISVY